jgi:hypothetical protein
MVVATVEDWYIKDIYLGTKAKQSVWTREEIDRWKNLALEGSFDTFGNYKVIDRSTLFDALRNVAKIQNQPGWYSEAKKPGSKLFVWRRVHTKSQPWNTVPFNCTIHLSRPLHLVNSDKPTKMLPSNGLMLWYPTLP